MSKAGGLASAILTLVGACWIGVLLATDEGCGDCPLTYYGPVAPNTVATLPAGTPDCKVTFVGASGIAIFDCPAPGSTNLYADPGCTAPAGLNVIGVERSTSGEDGGAESQIIVAVVDDRGPLYATNLKNWLGGTDFTLAVQCGGTLITALNHQSIQPQCP